MKNKNSKILKGAKEEVERGIEIKGEAEGNRKKNVIRCLCSHIELNRININHHISSSMLRHGQYNHVMRHAMHHAMRHVMGSMIIAARGS